MEQQVSENNISAGQTSIKKQASKNVRRNEVYYGTAGIRK